MAQKVSNLGPRIDDISPISNAESVDKLMRQKRRRRRLLILGGISVAAIVTIVAITYHDNAAKFISAIPDSFVSASHGRRVGYSASVNADRRVSLTDVTQNKFHPKRFNGTWISDHEILFPDSSGGISLMNAVDGMTFQVKKSKKLLSGLSVTFTPLKLGSVHSS